MSASYRLICAFCALLDVAMVAFNVAAGSPANFVAAGFCGLSALFIAFIVGLSEGRAS